MRILLLLLWFFPVIASAELTGSQLIVLKTEVTTDPIGMGYDLNATPQVLDLLNTPSKNIGGETIQATLTPRLLLEAIDPPDLTVGSKFSQGQLEFLKMIIAMSASLDDPIDEFRTKVTALFAWTPTPATKIALDAQNRRISRTEVLFGVGVIVSKDEYLAARDLP